jgi:hypothetical protein
MTEEEKKPWWELGDAKPEHAATVKELITQMDKMEKAGSTISRGYMVRLIVVVFLIGMNGYIMYMNIGNQNAPAAYVYGFLTILVYLDDLNLARKLRAIAGGQTQ